MLGGPGFREDAAVEAARKLPVPLSEVSLSEAEKDAYYIIRGRTTKFAYKAILQLTLEADRT